jgi:hypothetical protein
MITLSSAVTRSLLSGEVPATSSGQVRELNVRAASHGICLRQMGPKFDPTSQGMERDPVKNRRDTACSGISVSSRLEEIRNGSAGWKNHDPVSPFQAGGTEAIIRHQFGLLPSHSAF